jgi:hypothetical protein
MIGMRKCIVSTTSQSWFIYPDIPYVLGECWSARSTGGWLGGKIYRLAFQVDN